jgi:L-fuconolactonase
MAAGVVSCRPGQQGFEAYVRKVHEMPHIRGFRQVLHGQGTPKGTCNQPEFVRDIQLLGKLGMSWDICMRPTELADAAKLVDACPETRFILDHCGNGPARNPEHTQWKHDIAEMAKRENVVCKISGVITSVQPEWDPAKELEPIVLHCIESFGSGRAMFAGDWPVCTLRASFAEWVACLKTIVHGSSAADQRKLFHDNAAAFYRV